MMNNLYIGLGGTGISSVAEFAKKVNDINFNQGNEFVYIDTDESLLREYPYISGDFISLSRTVTPAHLVRDVKMVINDPHISDSQKKTSEQFLRWYDADNPQMKCNRSLSAGSEGVPMLARAMLYANYDTVKHQIRNKLMYIGDDGHATLRDVYVVSGTCGGTGAGIVIDIFYLMCEIMHEEHHIRWELPFNLLLVMPEGYIRELCVDDVRYRNYRLNAYALFDEINACLNDARLWSIRDYGFLDDEPNEPNGGMQWNKHRCYDNDVPPFQFDMFKYGFLFDSVNPMGYPMTHKEVFENVANFLLVTEMAWRDWPPFWEVFRNMMLPVKNNSRDQAYIKGFAASGLFVAQTWEELTRKYVHDKFIYQMLRYGFLGTKDNLHQEKFELEVNSFDAKIHSIVCEYNINALIANILNIFEGRSGYEDLTRIMDYLKYAVANEGKTPAIEKVMSDHRESRELANAVNRLLTEVREATYAMCSQWAMKYNLRHALQIVEQLDLYFDDVYKCKEHHIIDFKTRRDFFFLRRTEIRREESHQMIQEYVEYLVYRNLSNENDDYLDHCKQCLYAAIREVENEFHDYRIDGISVEAWEQYYIKYLYGLKNDSSKAICPNLDNLIDNKRAMLREANEVERDYAALVHQDENSKRPDMCIDASNPFLLYTYKQKCTDTISQRNGEWAKLFDITSSFFAKNITTAFATFAKEVEAEAVLLSTSDNLNKPFSNLVLSQKETVELASRISLFSGGINTDYRRADGPKMDLFVADFNNLPWLRNALFPLVNGMPAYNNLENVEIQSTEMPDRITKLHLELGYSFDDYRYFDDYRLYFEEFLKKYKENPSSCHQPYVDKRFLTEREPRETLAELFERKTDEE